MYPLLFKPIYKEMIWGGDGLRNKYGRDIPYAKTGEAWDISCRPNEMGIVKNGFYAGRRFIDVINENRQGYLGETICHKENFPLLVKLIDAKDNLSVQVHPDDKYAQNTGEIYGKSEMWYVLDAPEDAYLIIGLKPGVSREKFNESLKNGDVENLLGKLCVKKGDIINIPAGLIHAVTSGIMIAEIQQNSDITYRVYDYSRVDVDGKPRELHIDKAIDVIDFDGRIQTRTVQGLSVFKKNANITYLIANKYFAIEKYDIEDYFEDATDGAKFFIFTCVSGGCKIMGNGITVELPESESVFIPAGLGKYNIAGCCELIKSYVPEIVKDFINPLKAGGYSEHDIKSNTSIEIDLT